MTAACVCVSVCVCVFASLRRGHDAGYTLEVNLLHNVLRLDALLLAEDEDLSFLVLCPAVLIHPHFHLRVQWVSQHLSQQPVLDGLVGDAHNMADELANRVLESSDAVDELSVLFQTRPEALEVARLQQVPQVQDLPDWPLLLVSLVNH